MLEKLVGSGRVNLWTLMEVLQEDLEMQDLLGGFADTAVVGS